VLKVQVRACRLAQRKNKDERFLVPLHEADVSQQREGTWHNSGHKLRILVGNKEGKSLQHKPEHHPSQLVEAEADILDKDTNRAATHNHKALDKSRVAYPLVVALVAERWLQQATWEDSKDPGAEMWFAKRWFLWEIHLQREVMRVQEEQSHPARPLVSCYLTVQTKRLGRERVQQQQAKVL
jgi:hypothetical protein